MGRFFSLDYQSLTAAQQTKLETYVDELIHEEWLRLHDGQEFDSTTAPWFGGNPYPAPAAKLALFEWYSEEVMGHRVRAFLHEKARDEVVTPEFLE